MHVSSMEGDWAITVHEREPCALASALRTRQPRPICGSVPKAIYQQAYMNRTFKTCVHPGPAASWDTHASGSLLLRTNHEHTRSTRIRGAQTSRSQGSQTSAAEQRRPRLDRLFGRPHAWQQFGSAVSIINATARSIKHQAAEQHQQETPTAFLDILNSSHPSLHCLVLALQLATSLLAVQGGSCCSRLQQPMDGSCAHVCSKQPAVHDAGLCSPTSQAH